MKKTVLLALATLAGGSGAWAHFPIFIPAAPYEPIELQVGGALDMMFVFGHPFEQEYAATEAPERVFAVQPDGTVDDLTGGLTPGTYEVDGTSNAVFNVAFSPSARGDTILAVDSHPEFGFNNTIRQEFIKTIVHVEEQGGWDNLTGQPVEIVPLTRPYGLEKGYVFTGQVLAGGEPAAGATVLIEEFLPAIPSLADLPPEPFITKEVKTDPNGVFSYTLPNAAWWIIAAEIEGAAEVERDGQTYTLNGLGALWVKVEEPVEVVYPSGVLNWSSRR